MSTRLNLSSEVEQWLANLMNNLTEMFRRLDATYEKIPLPLLAAFAEACGGVWRVDYPSSEEVHVFFRCGEVYLRMIVDSYTYGEILTRAGYEPLVARILAEMRKAKERKYLRATRFKLQLGGRFLAYYGYEFPIGKVGNKSYSLCRVFASETLEHAPIACFSDECIEGEYTYEVCVSLAKQGLEITRYENKQDSNLPPTDLLNALYEKRDEIEKRIGPILKVLDEVTKGAISILLY
ncbi:MAG: hypothetical protein L7H00_03635 [Vulcanisaeta sp.]|nr:hypothetical protein [Vulcanisaeta sp.]